MAKNWAIAIGVNEYNRNNFTPLRFAKRDAEAVRDFFENEAGFDPVCFFSDDSPDLTSPSGNNIPTRPTGGNLFSFLQDRFEKPFLNKGDNCWFFFAGHGLQYQNRDYLIPIDAPNPREKEPTYAIPVSYIRERLSRSGADNVILLLDTCRDEGSRNSANASVVQPSVTKNNSHPSLRPSAPQDNLVSERSVDYQKLRNLLQASQWKAADQETLEVLLKVARREKERSLTDRDIQTLPCTDLRTINQLWNRYSNGNFGFSIQQQIWQNYGAPSGDGADWEKFGDAVGWRKRSLFKHEWISTSELSFQFTAPRGHLPRTFGLLFQTGMAGMRLFLSHVRSCRL